MSPFPPQDVAVVRELARRAYDLARSEEMESRRRRWRDVNGLRRPDRAQLDLGPHGCGVHRCHRFAEWGRLG